MSYKGEGHMDSGSFCPKSKSLINDDNLDEVIIGTIVAGGLLFLAGAIIATVGAGGIIRKLIRF